MTKLNFARPFAGLLLSILLGVSSAMADMVYHVTVDTSTLSGSSGYVDLQFNPGDSSAPNATASLSTYTGDITLLGNAVVSGNVFALPAALLFDNGTAFNDVFQSVLFGNNFAFDITFGGDFLASSGTGTAFALSLYALDEITPLLTTDANGTVLTTQLASLGSITHTTFDANALGAPSVVSISAVPVPAALWLLMSGLGLMPWFKRRMS